MDLRKVLFFGGSNHLPSVKIRCVEVAQKLGCDCIIDKHFVEQIPDKYSAFVCVKATFAPGELARLAQRGTVIWDIIDAPPPPEHVGLYLASTKTARELFRDYGRIVVIPHYHCNISGVPNPPELRRPAWIGNPLWRPKLGGLKYDYYDASKMNREDVVRAHRKIGIALNFRTTRPAVRRGLPLKIVHRFHIEINSGIKLINCLGFGTPSISAEEPAYHEIGAECTIITEPRNCARWVRALQNDDDLYQDLRKKCLRKADKYHLNTIAEKYRKLLHSL